MKTSNNWPSADYQSMVNFYGDVGMNQTRLLLPYPLRLAWDNSQRVSKITVHEKVAASMERVLFSIQMIYSYNEIVRLNLDQWGGCLNVRKKRGSTKSFSIHSWGAANDWWPQQNALNTRWCNARFSEPEYIAFLNEWIKEGWNPLGISWGKDAMHIEATDNDVQLLETPDTYCFAKQA